MTSKLVPEEIFSSIATIYKDLMAMGCANTANKLLAVGVQLEALQSPAPDGEAVGSRKVSDAEAIAWAERNDFQGSFVDLRAAIEDAQSIGTLTAPPSMVGDVELAAKRVVAAFEANGKANNFNINIHRECEQSMLALKAALEQA